LSQIQRNDRICDQFEAAWKAGPRPRLDDFLAKVPPAEWPDLLRELLVLDLDYRRQLGERPTLEQYRSEYPALGLDRFAALFAERTAGATLQHTPSEGQLPRVHYLGDYELLQEIAHGGMGVVYKARQISLNRTVAVKMILAGQLATQADHDRFHAEAEAAALLDHPNIVPIFEVGEYQGQHYFSMGYVDGPSLAARLMEGPLPPKEAAELAATVAEAVEYAHRQGVIHRDIKPANIVIDSHGRPRVTDFGLAKRVDSDSGLTATGQVLGTPSYMPPEQAAGQIRAIGPAADVYALGALLYAALTGRPPFQAATTVETLRQVIEHEPVPLRQLNAAVPRDLETIVLKCLEKSVPRRYATAHAVAEDLRRYLQGRPILARPVGRGERVWRWCRRQPVVAGLIAAVACTLLAGTIVSSMFAVKAYRERDRAELARQSEAERAKGERLAKLDAEARRAEAERQKSRAEAGEKKAEQEKQIAQSVRDFLLNKLLGQADSRNQANALLRMGALSAAAKEDPTIRELLDRAAEELSQEKIGASFPRQPLVQAEILQTVGRTYLGVGEHERSIGFLQRSAAIYRQRLGREHPDTLASMNDLGSAYLAAGKLDLALPLFEETLKLRTEILPPDHPDTLTSMNNLAMAYQAAGSLDLALPLFVKTLGLRKKTLGPGHADTLASMYNLASAYRDVGRLDLALPLSEETLRLMKENRGDEHPDTLASMNSLAGAYMAAARPDLALPLYEETLKLTRRKRGANHPDTLASMNNLALAYQAAGKLDLAVPLFVETRNLVTKKNGPNHPFTLTIANNLAEAYRRAGKFDLALPLFEETLKLRKVYLPGNHPDTLASMNNLAMAYWSAKQFDKSIPLFEDALKLQEAKLGRQHPQTLVAVLNLGANYKDAGRLAEALPLLEEGYRAAKKYPRFAGVGAALLDGYAQAGMVKKAAELASGLLADVRTHFLKESPQLAAQLAPIALSLLQAKAFAEAEPLLRECLVIREKTQPDEWTTFGTKSMLGGALLGQKKYAEAEPLLLAGYEGMKQRGEDSAGGQGPPGRGPGAISAGLRGPGEEGRGREVADGTGGSERNATAGQGRSTSSCGNSRHSGKVNEACRKEKDKFGRSTFVWLVQSRWLRNSSRYPKPLQTESHPADQPRASAPRRVLWQS
jgi:tRNA A-37 threonylcarbamoyl transferase component Bud32